jgi:phosphoribosyl 1,2-cyclic phosphodiesterase
MEIKLWGVRGSLPSPLAPAQIEHRIFELLQKREREASQAHGSVQIPLAQWLKQQPIESTTGFGGNTPCIEVRRSDSGVVERIIIDSGSGIRALGDELLAQGVREFTLLITHFHLDHLIGLPFFAPIYRRDCRVKFVSAHEDTETWIRGMFKKPYFPVEWSQLSAQIEFSTLRARHTEEINGFLVTPYRLDHPDPCWGYRIESSGRVYAHCVDTEATRISRESLGEDLPLYQGVHLMLFDAQYSAREREKRMNWGHGSAELGLEIACREKIEDVVFMHHDPASSDHEVQALVLEAQAYLHKHQASGGFVPRWSFAVEGAVIPI